MRTAPIVLTTLLAACGGESTLAKIIDQPAAPREIPRIEVDPPEWDFLGIPTGDVASKDITVRNVGNAPLVIDSWQLVGSEAFAIGAAPAGSEIGAGQEVIYTVEYRPLGETDVGSLDFVTNDPVDTYTSVFLTGGGLAPALDIEPDPLDLPPVLPGGSSSALATVFNPGGKAVTVNDIQVSGQGFSLPAPPSLPFDLEPGGLQTVEVAFTGQTLGEYQGQIAATGTTQLGITIAELTGLVAEKPVAVCDVVPPVVAAASGTATFIGSNSVDPGGYAIVAHRWSLVQAPVGSAASLPGGTSADRQFSPDLSGIYAADLVVENDQGVLSDSCRATLTAEIEQDLWIEMFWQHSGDDMDLHLVQNGGALESGDDCYYANCTWGGLPWGGPTTNDDPALDLDDIFGTGPENINIFDPAAGVYTIYVHDYPGSSFTGGNDVTVKVYLQGALVWSDTRTVTGEDTYTPFADIEWPAAVVTPL